MKVIQETRRAH